MASHHDEDTMPEETEGYKISQPKQSLAEYQEMGKCTTTTTSLSPPNISLRDVQWQLQEAMFLSVSLPCLLPRNSYLSVAGQSLMKYPDNNWGS